MKRLRLSGALLGLTALLSACGGGGTPDPTHSLTVKLDGVASAPITVTDTTTNARVFSGTLEDSKTFGGLKAGGVFKVEGGAVNGSTTPAVQSVTLDGDKTVTLGYTSSPQAGTTLDAAHVRGTVEGWTFGTGKLAVLLAYSDNGTVAVNSPTITPAGNIDTSLPMPREVHPFLQDCTFIGERSAQDFGAQIADLLAFSTQDDYLGSVTERTSDGTRVIRVYSDTAAHFKGTAVCPGSERMELDIQVTRGWNALTVTDMGGAEYRWNSRLRNLEADTRTTLSFRRAGERVWMTFRDSSDLTLRRGAQVTREVVLSQAGGISGEVTLETNVPGVTVTPSTVKLPALNTGEGGAPSALGAVGATVRPQSLGTTLTFTADENATAYNGPLEVVVKKGGEEVGRGTLYSFRLILPSVGVYISKAFEPMYVDQGGTGNIEVYVHSNDGFDGTTTLTVTGLPQGVSTPSTSVDVQVTPGASATVKIPLTVASDAPLGTSTVRVSSPDIRVSGMSGPTSVPLTIRPGRTAIGPVEGRALRAGNGLWVVESSSYGLDGSQMKLTRYGTDGKVAATRTFAVPYALRLISLPSGDVLAVEQDGNRAAYRMDDTGATTQLTSPFSSGDMISPTADARGRVWFVQHTYTNGTHNAALAHWDPASGEISVVDATRDYGYTPGSFAVSPDGQTLVFQLSSGKVVRIDAANETVTEHSLTNPAQNIVVNNAGAIWFLDGSFSLKRLNMDGTITFFEGVSVSELAGFDRSDDNLLWGKDFSGVLKIDALTGEVTRISTKEMGSIVPLNGGGVAVITKEYDYSTSRSAYSLSILK